MALPRTGKLDDPANREAVLSALRLGQTLADAAKAAGVSARMLTKYREQNAGFDTACLAARTLADGSPLSKRKKPKTPAKSAFGPTVSGETQDRKLRRVARSAPPRPPRPPRPASPDGSPGLTLLESNPWLARMILELDSLGGPTIRQLLEMTEEIARDPKHRAAGNALDKLWEIKAGVLMWEIRRELESNAAGPPDAEALPPVVDGEIVADAPDTRRASGLVILRVPKNGREAPGRGPQDEPEAEPDPVDLAGDGR